MFFSNNETARSIFKMFAAVAFIKEDNVIQAYEALEEHISSLRTSELLYGHFIGRHRTGHTQPLFAIRVCNQSERTENGISRTNNKVEG
ncbi:hypothetical protein HZS_2192 [Henneguya salminicola]|nr:hypothetical protein HZS_2192 [Henneguya salminicola]